MPPIRLPVKPVKTERTHEENQERAYIAASRRSDRSLEARVESARRASEIHKRRTGRGLKVSEADVINEEMYEEEDDDLSMQYRRLTAHLNTSSSDFNRRLAAYLASNVAMRSALGQAISSSYQQQYTQEQSNQAPFQQQFSPTSMIPPHMMHRSPNSFRYSPYPTPPAQNYSSHPDQRSPSGTLPQLASNASTTQHSNTDNKSNSEASAADKQASVQRDSQNVPNQRQAGSPSVTSPQGNTSGAQERRQRTSPAHSDTTGYGQHESSANVSSARATSPPVSTASTESSFPPLTTSMPSNTMMFPGFGFDASDPFGTNFYSGGQKMTQSPYACDPNTSVFSAHNGMSQTLAPSAFDSSTEQPTWPTATSTGMGGAAQSPFATAGFDYGFDPTFGTEFFNKSFVSDGSQAGSGRITPVDNEFATFIDPGSWEESTG